VVGAKGVNRGESLGSSQIQQQASSRKALPKWPDRHPDKEAVAGTALQVRRQCRFTPVVLLNLVARVPVPKDADVIDGRKVVVRSSADED
jgi:hypothetical protein